jgi:hypothetical protein
MPLEKVNMLIVRMQMAHSIPSACVVFQTIGSANSEPELVEGEREHSCMRVVANGMCSANLTQP